MQSKNQTYLDQSAQIKEKLRNRDYRIGLDLGVGSIGFAILSMEENSQKILLPTEIIMSGSRIFKSSDGAKNRRMFRGQRNNHRHARERMRYLWKLLASQKLALSVPAKLEQKENSSEQETSSKRFSKEVLQKDVYKLRVKALDEKISLQEIGYALYHIANHRGSSAIRTFEEDSEETQKENTENKRIAGEVKRAMKEKNYRTYGEYLYREKFENKERYKRERVSNTTDTHQFSPIRDFAVKEAQAILNNQTQYHKESLTNDYIKQILEAINYETEKLIPESGYCPYFKDEKRLPRSHKLNEERRLWEALNNARYSQPVVDEKTGEITSFEEKQFSKEQKEELLSKCLLLGSELTQDKTKKLLKLESENVESQDIVLQGRDKKTQKIKGYKLRGLEDMPFWKRLSKEQQKQFLYDWNSCPDEKVLKDKLKNEYKLTDEEIDEAFDKRLPSSYVPLGESAMIIVLEKIKVGLSYTEAIEEALKEGKLTKDKQSIKDKLPYYGAVLPESTQAVIAKGSSKQFANRKYKTPHTNKDERKYGRIANPVVHQTLNELRKLVNELIEIFGKKPVEIGLETARELKKSVKDRKQLSKEQSDNENRRNKIYETYIKEHQQTIETRNENPKNYILKFELFDEQKKICPFCLQPINVDDIINNKVDIEHLFPISESEDNTRNNLVISHADCNQKKGKRSPFNAFGSSPDYKSIFANAKKNLPKKAWRFHQGTFEKFIENKPMKKRFETDNSYISKVAHKYLSCLFEKPNIICVKGSLTAQLRLAWDLQGMLIPFAKALASDKEIENFNNDVNKNKKIRLDNRNHALDAIVIAFASRGYGNLLNKLAGQGYKIDYKAKNWLSKILLPPNNNDRRRIEEDLKSFKDSIKIALANSFISVKHDHNDNGKLTKATMYKIYNSKDGYTLTTRKKLREIKLTDKKKTPKEVLETALLFEGNQDELKNEEIKNAVERNKNLFEAIQNKLPEAESSLKEANEKAKTEGKKETSINEISIYKKAISLLSGKPYYTYLDKRRDPRNKPSETTTGYGYDTGGNLCIDLYHDNKGKLLGEIIRKIDAQQKITPNYKNKKFKLFERIYGGDILEVDYITNNNGKLLSLKNRCNSAIPNRTFIRVNTYYETKNNTIQIRFSNIIKRGTNKDNSFNLNSMQEYSPRKVILSPCGLIKYRSPILKNIVK